MFLILRICKTIVYKQKFICVMVKIKVLNCNELKKK